MYRYDENPTVYQTCYSLTRSESAGSVNFGDETRSRSSYGSSEDEDNFSYEEQCCPELRDLLTDRLETRIRGLTETGDFVVVVSGLRETLSRAVDDIIRLSEDEPYGVRGALISVKFKDSQKGSESLLGRFAMDEDTVSTFKLVLVLQEERKISVSLRNWFGHLTGGKRIERFISPKYLLSKFKLYRSSSDVEFY